MAAAPKPRTASKTAAQRSVITESLRLLRAVAVVLQAHELEQFLIGHDPLVVANRPRRRVELRIVDGDIDLHAAISRAAEPLRNFRRVAERRAEHVEPAVVAQARGFDDQRVLVPVAYRIAVPP